ncbi:hypothetical protein [Caulobacter sp. NIBR1757]|uniref:hypothetical protein n=1 Tax=Caulobacter sp. NIBR1757 TaxID=3016000 RepID=UPI0022F00860|nr:hypothetical protein [Caulobacter sp. NIBR1757]
MTAEFTVGAGFARGLLDFPVRKGALREALLTAAGPRHQRTLEYLGEAGASKSVGGS